MRIVDSVLDLVGRTPMVRLRRLPDPGGAEVVLKLESANPGGSVKDRPALNMILAAEGEGVLHPSSVIIEATSGNTGIGLAMTAAARGYRAVIVMPENVNRERIALMLAYGAEVVLMPRESGMKGAVEKAEALARTIPNSFIPQQFRNPNNPEIHRRTTAKEILEQTEGRLDVFVASAGTGGTITGVGEVLKESLPQIEIVVVEPAGSPVLSGGCPGIHNIPGMGPGFIPEILNRSVYDRIIRVTDDDALMTARLLAAREGLLVGPSSGAVAWAALAIAAAIGSGKRVVGIAPDTGERYISTGLYDVPLEESADSTSAVSR